MQMQGKSVHAQGSRGFDSTSQAPARVAGQQTKLRPHLLGVEHGNALGFGERRIGVEPVEGLPPWPEDLA